MYLSAGDDEREERLRRAKRPSPIPTPSSPPMYVSVCRVWGVR